MDGRNYALLWLQWRWMLQESGDLSGKPHLCRGGQGRVGSGWWPRGPLGSYLWFHHSGHSPKAESDLWCSLSFWVCQFVVVVLTSTILLFLNQMRAQVFQGYTQHPLFPNMCTHLVSKNALSGSHYWSNELVGKIESEPVWGKQAHACRKVASKAESRCPRQPPCLPIAF